MSYVPLRVFSPFSVGFGAVKVTQLADWCREHRVPAAGVADRDTLGGAMSVSRGLSAAGVQPLIGGVFRASHGGFSGDVVAFSSSQEGYEALLRLANRWNATLSPEPAPVGELRSILGRGGEDVILLTGGGQGLVEALLDRDPGQADDALGILARDFGDRLYVEIAREDAAPGPREAALRAMAQRHGLPLVATQEAHYATADMETAHDAFLCVADKTYLDERARRRARPGLPSGRPRRDEASLRRHPRGAGQYDGDRAAGHLHADALPAEPSGVPDAQGRERGSLPPGQGVRGPRSPPRRDDRRRSAGGRVPREARLRDRRDRGHGLRRPTS